jgi:3-oxoacyl-[acyl-carrier-protein] synthase II
VEAVATIEALRRDIAPPTVGWEERDPDLDLDYVPGEARALERRSNGSGPEPLLAISNSFGFGGHNAVLCIAA